MTDLTKFFNVQHAYVDEDGFLSFNPKHGEILGSVAVTNMQTNQDHMNITSFQDEQPQYVTTMESCTVQYEINIMPNILGELDNYEKQPKKRKKTEIKKDVIQGPFAFLNLKED